MSRPNGSESPKARATPPVAALPDRACNGEDPKIFFPNSRGSSQPAIKICGRCPHRRPCLDWALETRQSYGIWGGVGPDMRHQMIEERA